jgi:hypothetical protein
LLFNRLSGCEGTRGKIGVARIECSNTQRQKHCEEEGDHGKRPIAASHGSTPFKAKKDDEFGMMSQVVIEELHQRPTRSKSPGHPCLLRSESGQISKRLACPLCAKSDRMHCKIGAYSITSSAKM